LAATLGAVIALALGAALATGRDNPGESGHREQAGDHHRGQHRGAAERALFAVLSGRNELGGEPLRRRAGGPDGRGSSNVTIDGTDLCWGIAVTNLSQPVAAHIHKGKRNENGGIVVTLAPPSAGDPGASSGCEEIAADLARDIQRHPRRYYVNVHTGDFPGGAVRGQLFGKRR